MPYDRTVHRSLYDPNNFYYCRLIGLRHTEVVYMTQTISTIVDKLCNPTVRESLYDPNNFYYCRYCLLGVATMLVYMTQTISTIVDLLIRSR